MGKRNEGYWIFGVVWSRLAQFGLIWPDNDNETLPQQNGIGKQDLYIFSSFIEAEKTTF